MLPRRIPKPAKRASRWKSTAHRDFVRSHACCTCGSMVNIQAAHLRKGSGAGLGQKPDDWLLISLCGGDDGISGCHAEQHRLGEEPFDRKHNIDSQGLAAMFAAASPKAADIRRAKAERMDA